MAYKDVGQPGNSGWRSASIWRRTDFWLMILGVAGLALGIWFVSGHLIALIEQAARARAFVTGLGALAPLVYIALFAAQILIAPLPGQFMGVMSGYLFGVFWGSLYSILGLAVGAGLAMLLARRYGRPLLERFFDPGVIRGWERKLRMRSPVTWALLFVFPVPDVVFYAAGLSRVPLRHLLIAVIAGRSVGLIFANLMGTLSATMPPEWVIVKWIALGVVALIAYAYQRNIRYALLVTVRWLKRFMRRRRQELLPADKA